LSHKQWDKARLWEEEEANRLVAAICQENEHLQWKLGASSSSSSYAYEFGSREQPALTTL
jgi:hypothetical protein